MRFAAEQLDSITPGAVEKYPAHVTSYQQEPSAALVAKVRTYPLGLTSTETSFGAVTGPDVKLRPGSGARLPTVYPDGALPRTVRLSCTERLWASVLAGAAKRPVP